MVSQEWLADHLSGWTDTYSRGNRVRHNQNLSPREHDYEMISIVNGSRALLDYIAQYAKHLFATCAKVEPAPVQSLPYGKSRPLFEITHSGLSERDKASLTAPLTRVFSASSVATAPPRKRLSPCTYS